MYSRSGRCLGIAELFTGPGEIEPAGGHDVVHGGQQVVGSVDIGVVRGKVVVEGAPDETLRRQVIALVGQDALEDVVNAGVILKGCGVEIDVVQDGVNPCQPVLGVLQRNATDNSVDGTSLGQQQLRLIGSILSRNSCYKSTFGAYGGQGKAGRSDFDEFTLW